MHTDGRWRVRCNDSDKSDGGRGSDRDKGGGNGRGRHSPQTVPKPKPKPAEPAPTLAEEIQLVSNIWDALQRKKHGEAGKLIKRHKKRFAKGQMRQEREAAEVLWLCATGRSERAHTARTKFLDRYPESSHRARVEAACD